MATTARQDQDFLEDLRVGVPDDLLEQAIDWIKAHLAVEDVFDETQLEGWARDNGFIEDEE